MGWAENWDWFIVYGIRKFMNSVFVAVFFSLG